MRKLIFSILCVLNVCLIFFPSESLAWWWQKPKPDTLELQPVPGAEQVEEKLIQSANQRFRERVKEFSAQNNAMAERNEILQAELNRISADRQDLLKKLKDYTVHRQKLDTRVRMLEAGIINLDKAKKGLDEANKSLSETNKVLSADITALKKEPWGVREVRRVFKKKLRGERKKYRKQLDKLNTAVKELKKESKENKKAWLEEKKYLRADLKTALNEFSDSKTNLEKFKEEVAIMHYNLGIIFARNGNYHKALEEYGQVLKVKPDDADTHYNMALIYDTCKKDRRKAIEHYREYLEIEPEAGDSAKVKKWITEVELEHKIWEKEK